MDRLKQLREPATAVALVGLALHLVLTLVYLLLAPAADGVLLADLALSLVNPLLVALPTVLVASCWFAEPTPRARGLTVLGLLLTAALLATTAGLLVAGVVGAPVDAREGLLAVFLGAIPWLTTAVISLGVFVVLLRRPSVAATQAVDAVQPGEPAEPVPAPHADPQLQPGWSPDAAVGAVWRRAGDAAAGAPATSWNAMGQTTGRWGPPPTETSPFAPSEQPAPPPEAASPGADWPDVRGDWSAPGRG